MPAYHVFGGILESPIEFLELRPAGTGAVPDWVLRVLSAGEAPEGTELGREQLMAGVHARLLRTPQGAHVLALDDTGTFIVRPDGRTIDWHAQPGASQELARVDLTGRVLAVSWHARGNLCLHASAVVHHGRATGFLAPKGFGKTTTALALVTRGARLLTDDTLPVVPATGVAHPGVHVARLTADGVARYASLGDTRPSLSEKSVLSELPDDRIAEEPVPLAALYVLTPVDPAGQSEITRERLPAALAVITLIQYSKLGPLLGGAAAAEVLDRAAQLAARVPVYRLRIPRDLAALDRDVARIEGFIEAEAGAAPGGSGAT